MYYSGIKDVDVANCEGVGVSIFVSGCTHHCDGCFNPETWSFKYGKEFTNETLQYLKGLVNKDYITCFSVLGGEPFEEQNMDTVYEIIKEVKKVKDLKVYIWSGYTYEVLIKNPKAIKILKLCDILVDGEFEKDKKDISLKLRGSSNQRIINLKECLNEDIIM